MIPFETSPCKALHPSLSQLGVIPNCWHAEPITFLGPEKSVNSTQREAKLFAVIAFKAVRFTLDRIPGNVHLGSLMPMLFKIGMKSFR